MNSIPKKLHIVWVGPKKMPQAVVDRISNFRCNNPEFEIKVWGNDAYEKMKADGFISKYAEEAFKENKWAFVSDVIRLYAVFTEGGWYMDTDVHSIAPMSNLEPYTHGKGLVLGRCHEYFIETGTFGAIPHHPVVGAWLEHFRTRPFIIDNKHSLIENNSIQGVMLAEEFGYHFGGNETFVSDKHDYVVLPIEAFNGLDLLEKPLTRMPYSVTDHRPECSWVSKTDRHSQRAAVDNFMWSKLGDDLYRLYQTKELREYMERNVANYRLEKLDGHYRIWL